MYQKFSLAFFIIIFSSPAVFCQYSIKGEIVDSENKYSKIALEYVPSFRGLSSTVIENVVNSSLIDSAGMFTIVGDDLPNKKGLYRLSLLQDNNRLNIVSGVRKNFMHIVLDNNSHLELVDCPDVANNFGNCKISGNVESMIIQDFYDKILVSFYDDYKTLTENNSELKQQLIHRKHTELLANYCDTSQYLIPSLVAYAHISDLDSEIKSKRNFFSSYLDKSLKLDSDSPYALELKQEIESKIDTIHGSKNERFPYLNWLLLSILIGAGFYIFSLRKEIKKLKVLQNSPTQVKNKIQSLSQKEAEVFEHIINGMSNKEIARTLFIEVTTVKSHISKIYQKLNVKTRKEAIQLGLKHSK